MTGRRRFRPDPSLRKPKLSKPPAAEKRSTPKSSSPPRHGNSNARWLAFRALQANRERDVFVSRVLDDQFQESSIPSRDRKMATELANETVRRRGTLDAILRHYVSRDPENVEPDLWTILQLGCVQLACLPHISTHAAVNETVELCHLVQNSKAKGFINGVLRNIERGIVSRDSVESIALESLDGKSLPLLHQQGAATVYQLIRFSDFLFANPGRDALAYVSDVTSLPEWLLQRLVGATYASDDMLRMGLWMTTSGRMSLRVNPLQTDREKTLEVLAAAEVPARPGQLPESIELDGSVAIIDLPGYREGWFSVQDVSAMSATDLLNPQPGETILDLCAAPGGKTTHIAERMRNQGKIVACDTAANRIRTIQENAGRLQLSNIETHLVGEDGTGVPDLQYDAVLVDVPCSNTGVLGKRPEARWRLMPMSFRELVPLQVQILERALSHARSGGRVVYSTCSIDNEENRGVVQLIVAKMPNLKLIEERHHQPGHPSDGGYQALLIKS